MGLVTALLGAPAVSVLKKDLSDMISVKYDEKLGIVRVDGEGFFSVTDGAKAATAVAEAIAQCRSAHGDLKLLVNCSSYVQDPSVMEAAKGRQPIAGGRRDRVAFVFSSSLAKMQASRYFNSAKGKCFISEDAAIKWLLADRDSSCVCAA